jgi:hypothetical protein
VLHKEAGWLGRACNKPREIDHPRAGKSKLLQLLLSLSKAWTSQTKITRAPHGVHGKELAKATRPCQFPLFHEPAPSQKLEQPDSRQKLLAVVGYARASHPANYLLCRLRGKCLASDSAAEGGGSALFFSDVYKAFKARSSIQ